MARISHMSWPPRRPHRRDDDRNEPSPARKRVEDVSVAGDELLRTLYAEHAGPLLGYVIKLTDGDRQRAEDVVQETLLRAWRHPESLDPSRGSLRPWLWTVARNIVVDAARARRARPQEVAEDALAVIPVEDQIDQALLSWEVAEALGTLSDDHRAVLVETYYRGRTVAEAAEVLGIPAGTVKSRAFYALRALRLALEERGITP
jgi:RNA polymerase sigma-70 factor (ECF subfamily)